MSCPLAWWHKSGKYGLTQNLLTSARECFSQTAVSLSHPFAFKNTKMEGTLAQKHLDFNLDRKLTFQYHVNKKTKKGVDLLWELRPILL